MVTVSLLKCLRKCSLGPGSPRHSLNLGVLALVPENELSQERDTWPGVKRHGEAFDKTAAFLKATAKGYQDDNVGPAVAYYQLGGTGTSQESVGQTAEASG